MAAKPQSDKTINIIRGKNLVENRPMPSFPGGTFIVGSTGTVVSDAHGTLYRVDVDAGSIRKLRWEQ